MAVGNLADDGESESCAAGGRAARRVQPIEGLEDILHALFGNAGATVQNSDTQLPRFDLHGDIDRTLPCMKQRVFQQVAECAPQVQAWRGELQGRALQRDAFWCGAVCCEIHEQRMQVEPAGWLALQAAGQIEHVADQSIHLLDVPFEVVEGPGRGAVFEQVGSRRAGERVLAGLTKLYERLHLKVNETKTAVAPASRRKFLGYAFWYGSGGQVKCRVADKALKTFKQRIRQFTCRSGGRNLTEIAERLRAYMPGWKAYFQLAQTPNVFRELDKWIRHRLRAVQLKHWRRGTTMYRELKALGASETDARQVAANSRRWWRSRRFLLNRAMPVAYFDRLGVPRLS